MNGQDENQYDEPIHDEPQPDEPNFIEDDEELLEDVDVPFGESDPQAEIERLVAEKDALYEKLARVQADFQNASRRIERDNAQRLALTFGAFIKELLPVLDNLERAMQVSPDAPAAQVIGGVKGTFTEFMSVLGRQQVERIEPTVGTPFDPNEHEALMQQPSDEYDEPAVTQLLQAGYRQGARVLRPAQVAVSSVG